MGNRYNGWTNYETWAVALWIDNEEASLDDWTARATEHYRDAVATEHLTREEVARYDLAQAMKDEFEEANPLSEAANVWADLMNAALSEVDWDELADHYLTLEVIDAIHEEERDEEVVE